MMNYLQIIKDSKIDVKSELYLHRYLKFCKHCILKQDTIDISVYTEKHHILPVSLFPEYSRSKENIVKVTGREHYLMHWMLAKALGDRMWYAFNMMSRIIPSKSSLLYQYAREEIRRVISENKTGWVMPDYLKELASERTKDTVVVKDKQGNKFRVSIYDKRYLSGELVYYRTGTKHKKSTLIKMSKNNHMKNKKPFHCPKTDKMGYYTDINSAPDGWIEGPSKESRMKNSKSLSELKWYHDPKTKKNVRCKEKPNGYVEGRYFKEGNKGFESANSMINVVDLLNRKCTKVKQVEWYHSSESGRSTNNTIVYRHNNYVFTSAKCFISYLHSIGIYIEYHIMTDIKRSLEYTVPKRHGRCNIETNEFREKNFGKKLSDFGIELIPLSEFILNDKDKIWKQKT